MIDEIAGQVPDPVWIGVWVTVISGLMLEIARKTLLKPLSDLVGTLAGLPADMANVRQELKGLKRRVAHLETILANAVGTSRRHGNKPPAVQPAGRANSAQRPIRASEPVSTAPKRKRRAPKSA